MFMFMSSPKNTKAQRLAQVSQSKVFKENGSLRLGIFLSLGVYKDVLET